MNDSNGINNHLEFVSKTWQHWRFYLPGDIEGNSSYIKLTSGSFIFWGVGFEHHDQSSISRDLDPL